MRSWPGIGQSGMFSVAYQLSASGEQTTMKKETIEGPSWNLCFGPRCSPNLPRVIFFFFFLRGEGTKFWSLSISNVDRCYIEFKIPIWTWIYYEYMPGQDLYTNAISLSSQLTHQTIPYLFQTWILNTSLYSYVAYIFLLFKLANII